MHDALQAGQFFRPEELAGYPGTAFIPGQHFHRQLNIGGGQRLLPDWTNLDSLYGVMVNDDLFSRIPDGCIQHVFSSHFIEHLTQKDALRMFRHVRRVLAGNGILRLCAPDIDEFARQFSHEPQYQEVWWRSVWQDRPAHLSRRDAFVQMGGNAQLEDSVSEHVGHIWPQSYGVLFWMLTCAGFDPEKIRRAAFGDSRIPDVRTHQMDNRSNHTFYLEASVA